MKLASKVILAFAAPWFVIGFVLGLKSADNDPIYWGGFLAAAIACTVVSVLASVVIVLDHTGWYDREASSDGATGS